MDRAPEEARGLCGPVATTKDQVPKWMWELQLDPVGSGSWPLGTGPRCTPRSGLRVTPCVLLTLGVQVATLIWSPLGPWTVTIGSPGKGNQKPALLGSQEVQPKTRALSLTGIY